MQAAMRARNAAAQSRPGADGLSASASSPSGGGSLRLDAQQEQGAAGGQACEAAGGELQGVRAAARELLCGALDAVDARGGGWAAAMEAAAAAWLQRLTAALPPSALLASVVLDAEGPWRRAQLAHGHFLLCT